MLIVRFAVEKAYLLQLMDMMSNARIAKDPAKSKINKGEITGEF